jgi:sugar phosphate isomerase/epimerase
LSGELAKLIGQASHYDITLQLENEPVCNIGNIAELAGFFAPREAAAEAQRGAEDDEDDEAEEAPQGDQIYLRPLVDIANAWATGEKPSDAHIGTLAPLTTAIHLKDRDLSARCTVPLGDGDVPWTAELRRLLSGVQVPQVLASIETHCPHDARNATARSLAGLRRIAAEIGVEIV